MRLRTVCIKVGNQLTDSQKQSIIDTSIEYNKCTYDFIDKCCYEHKTVGISKYYHEVRDNHPGVPAEIVMKARTRAEGLVKVHNSMVKADNAQIKKRNARRYHKGFDPLPYKEYYAFNPELSVSGYNLTKSSVSFKNDKCNLLTVNGRIKFECKIPEWFTSRYPDMRFYSAHISCKEISNTCKEREFKLYVTYSIDENTPTIQREITPDTTIGIDRGIYIPAALSNGTIISDNDYYAVTRKYAHDVETLKQKHTSSARKRLRSIRGKRKRFNNNKNHIISKQICSTPNVSCIVFEDLTNINKSVEKSTLKSKKKNNRWRSSWSFKDLEQKIVYKAEALGITIAYVKPQYTSVTCPICGYVETYKGECRNGARFKCSHCGHTDHADVNAAINIRNRYLESVGLLLASTPNIHRLSQGVFNHP